MMNCDPGLMVADRWQREFPLCDRPFAVIASAIGRAEAEVINWLSGLQQRGIMSRIGAVVRPNTAGASTLAALSCHPIEIADIAATVSAEHFVNHNYERDHVINLWFVVAAPSEAELSGTIERISRATGRDVLDLRLERPYHIDLGFRLSGRPGKSRQGLASRRRASAQERAVLATIEDGLAFEERPYAAVAQKLGMAQAKVISIIQAMLDDGIIARFGCVIRHREIGYTANAMAVWNIPDDMADEAGLRLAAEEGVTLCYRRNRQLPHWTYNLFAMVHGRREPDVRNHIEDIANRADLRAFQHDVLFSRRCFTQRGARFAVPTQEAAA